MVTVTAGCNRIRNSGEDARIATGDAAVAPQPARDD